MAWLMSARGAVGTALLACTATHEPTRTAFVDAADSAVRCARTVRVAARIGYRYRVFSHAVDDAVLVQVCQPSTDAMQGFLDLLHVQ